LQFKAMGFSDKEIYRFDFLDPPKRDAWRHADRALRMLGAIDDHCRLTSTGELMAEIPLAPQITRMLIAAKRLGCVDQTVTIAASFAARPVFIRPIGEEEAADEAHEPWQDTTSDFATLLKVIDAWRRSSKEEKVAFCELNYLHPRALQEIDDVSREIKAILTDFGWHITSCRKLDTIGQAVMSGLAANLLINSGHGYRLISKGEPERQQHDKDKRGKHNREPQPNPGRVIRIHPGSSLAHGHWPEFIVAAEIQETTQIWARRVQAVEEYWLKLLPNEVRNLIPRRKKHHGDKHCHDKSKRHHDHDRDRGRGRHR
jgi:HrpA-like RNA helicase